jgi:polygalacturonase
VQSGGINVGSNQTLYIAGGAFIQGRISASGSSVTIRGRGIIDGAGINIQNSNHVRVEGVICKGSTGWTVTPRYCDSVTIQNVKVCNSRNLGDDAMDIVNCTNVLVKRCFLRCDDDNIAIKGYIHSTLETATWDKPCSSITIEDCAFWTDRANTFRIGFETEIQGAEKNITARNCDVVHTFNGYSGINDYWANTVWYIQPTDNMAFENFLFEDIRIDNGKSILIKLIPMIRSGWGWNGVQVGKYVKNVTFRNITWTGTAAPPIYISGVDATHYVQDISLVNVNVNGICTQRTSAGVTVGPNVANLTFACNASRTTHPEAETTPAPSIIAVRQSAQGVHFDLPGAGEFAIRITNAGGQIVALESVRTNDGDGLICRMLPAGMYAAHVVAGSKRFAARFVVAN